MAKKARSARGKIVDFDLLKIKQQIGARPSTSNVQVRQDFIEKKIHRGRVKKTIYPKAPLVPAVNVQTSVPGTEDISVDKMDISIDDTETHELTTNQKARPKI